MIAQMAQCYFEYLDKTTRVATTRFGTTTPPQKRRLQRCGLPEMSSQSRQKSLDHPIRNDIRSSMWGVARDDYSRIPAHALRADTLVSEHELHKPRKQPR